jgi:GDPmannose 4,6-dehydratase
MKAVIYGASGQDGFYLTQLCRSKGMEVIAYSRSGSCGQSGDITDLAQVVETISTHQPGYVFHLAANSTTRHDVIFENHATIATGALNVLEACYAKCPDARIFLAGSGLQFANAGRPIVETDEFAATSPYCVARISSVYAARYFRSLGLRAYVGYLFHHDSPLRKPGHMSKLIASAAARISKGKSEVLEIGDLDVEKEWVFAGDIVEGIWCLVNQDKVFEATIGSGEAHSIRSWAIECFSKVGLNALDHIKTRPGFHADFNRLVSNPKTINAIGWAATTSMSALSSMMVEAELASAQLG